ncbi:ubiquinol-cytochrome C chaperone family protein [Sphingomonas crusticola]|uniref:ubiquinol-cytochrome C chaperone family protein n=1 Tax=Sphingomonas crusticola TaxID=1697973 RepID=UPI000E2566EC|nr:ubiquinol-cytochrome C chaperone family protein [Sphingomonas crusticola]
MIGVWRRLFGHAERDRLAPLYRAVVAEARRPAWYRDGRVPDTLDGRFDMVAAILSLVLLRLETDGDSARAPSAYLTELFVDDMDGQLRQRGIGDIVVGKHIGRMMGALGGRLGALREAFAGGDLDDVIQRNIYRGMISGSAALAEVRNGLLDLRNRLAAAPTESLIEGEWPE